MQTGTTVAVKHKVMALVRLRIRCELDCDSVLTIRPPASLAHTIGQEGDGAVGLGGTGGEGLPALLLLEALDLGHALHLGGPQVVHVEELAPPRRNHLHHTNTGGRKMGASFRPPISHILMNRPNITFALAKSATPWHTVWNLKPSGQLNNLFPAIQCRKP